jgi:hypothetical protein
LGKACRGKYTPFLFDIGKERFGIIFDMKFPPPDIVDTLIDIDGYSDAI